MLYSAWKSIRSYEAKGFLRTYSLQFGDPFVFLNNNSVLCFHSVFPPADLVLQTPLFFVCSVSSEEMKK
jgi:hypothetical protein